MSVDSVEPEDLVREQARKKRTTRLVLFGAIPAVLVIGGYVAYQSSVQAAREAIESAWTEAGTCVLGGPLAEGTSPARRFREVQARALDAPGESGVAPWPETCADKVAALQQALIAHGSADEPLATAAEALAIKLRGVEHTADFGEWVEPFVQAARDRGLSTSDFPSMPAERTIYTVDSMPEGARLSDKEFGVEGLEVPDAFGRELPIMLHDPQLGAAPRVCTFGPKGPEVTCVDARVKEKGLHLVGTAARGVTPVIAAGRRGQDGIYRVDGSKVAAESVGTVHAGDGYVAYTTKVVDGDDMRLEVVQQRGPDAPLERAAIDASALGAPAVDTIAVFFDLLVAHTFDPDDRERPHLFFKRLPADELSRGFTDAGELNWVNAPYAPCQSEAIVGLRVGSDRGFVTIFDGEAFSAPYRVDLFSGPETRCVGEEVFIGEQWKPQRCDTAGCKGFDPAVQDEPAYPLISTKRARIGDAMLSVTTNSKRAGLRTAFGKTSSTMLFDDLVAEGKVWKDSSVTGHRLIGMGDYAVLLLSTKRGLFAFWIGKDGEPVPAKVSPG